MMKSRIFIAATLLLPALICMRLFGAPVDTTQQNQPAEDACLHAYDVCYNNCKGRADVCYSNCDVAYKHCMHGAGVDFAQLKKHPRQPPQAVAPNKGGLPTATPRKGPGNISKLPKSSPTPQSSATIPPVLLKKSDSSTPTPTPKKSHQ